MKINTNHRNENIFFLNQEAQAEEKYLQSELDEKNIFLIDVSTIDDNKAIACLFQPH